VGDAGHFKDFTPAQSISDAPRQAKHLAATVHTGMATSTLDASTMRWWTWRDRDASEMYWLAADMGIAGASTPLTTRLLRDSPPTPPRRVSCCGVLNHELPPSRLFTAT
jgi:hypothetical protein